MEGISRRELARRQGIAESSIRRHLASGALAAAVNADGSLDPDKATAALAGILTHSKAAPIVLTAARTRRLRAQVRAIHDEVAEMQAGAIPPKDAKALLAEQRAIIARHVRPIADAAAKLAGLAEPEARTTLKDLVNYALEAVSGDPGVDDEDPWWDEPLDGRLELDTLAPNLLLAKRIDLAAQKLEVEHALGHGDLVRVEEVAATLEERLTVSKSLLLALSGRVAQQIEGSSPDAIRTLVATELDGALAELGGGDGANP